VNADDMDDFRRFCDNATNAQLDAIIEKERAAGREEYATIAEWVKGWREAPFPRHVR
jgi:hypothetical protein